MKRSIPLLALFAPIFVAQVAVAADRPNYSAYAVSAPLPPPVFVRAGLPAASVASVDEKAGLPTFLWAARGNAAIAPTATPEDAARYHLARHAPRYGLSFEALSTAQVQNVLHTKRGGYIVVLRQHIDGIEVFHHDVKVVLDRSLDLVAITGNLHPGAVLHPKTTPFNLREVDAVANAFGDLYGVAAGASDFANAAARAPFLRFDLVAGKAAKASGARFRDAARVKRIYYPLPDRLVPAFFLELDARTSEGSDAYSYVIAADDGRILHRQNLTYHDTFQYRVWADATGDKRPHDGPLADFTPQPAGVPNGAYPAGIAPVLVSVDGLNTNPEGTSDPWLPSGATVTTGNNSVAYTDDDNPDGFSPGDIRASTTSTNTFDHTYDLTQDPQSSDEQRMASVTSLFYTTNWLHDWWYDSGYDEKAGNAQEDNYGRGGLQGDPMQTQAQNGAPEEIDNSNMQPFSDGKSPVMQMFVWDGPSTVNVSIDGLGSTVTNGVADFGPTNFNVTAPIVLVDDGTDPTSDACQPIQNDLTGKIALIDRGTCSFQSKAAAAQTAGASAVIIADFCAMNGQNCMMGEAPFEMAGDPMAGAVTIGSFMISQADGATLKTELAGGPVNGTLLRSELLRDGTIDNSIVAHEWGHSLHLRQVSCISHMCSGESEGWADFDALLMVIHEGDDLSGVYPLGQYATLAPMFSQDAGYFGIRRYPYSIDFTKYPLTFKHMQKNTMLPPASVAPISDGTIGIPNSEVHNIGEIWASMLFESYIGLLGKTQGANPAYTYDQAHRRMADYVEGGLVAAPVDPTITEQRDAVLSAAAAADPDDFRVIAEGFAHRGAGTCAVSPPRESTDMEGVVESFVISPNVEIVSFDLAVTKDCDKDGYLDVGETGKVTVKIMNAGVAPLTDAKAKVSSNRPTVLFPDGDEVSFGTLAPFATATASVTVTLDPKIDVQGADLNVDVTSAESCNKKVSATFGAILNVDEEPMSSTIDNVEYKDTTWTIGGDNGKSIWSREDVSSGNYAWLGIDFAAPSDTNLMSPELDVSKTDPFVMTFSSKHSFEQSMGINWDGAVLEISLDDGTTWQDISTYGDPGYGGLVGDTSTMNPAHNALKGRQGYVGQNKSWPQADTIKVDMGKTLAGEKVRIRFRIGSDDANGAYGWRLDDIGFTGITNQPFAALVPDSGHCSNGTGGGGGSETTSTTSGGGGAGGGGGSTPPDNGGCGCHVAGDGTNTHLGWLSLLALAALRRRNVRRAKR